MFVEPLAAFRQATARPQRTTGSSKLRMPEQNSSDCTPKSRFDGTLGGVARRWPAGYPLSSHVTSRPWPTV
jgi:hypothetical protein